jgi:hypothetical protein
VLSALMLLFKVRSAQSARSTSVNHATSNGDKVHQRNSSTSHANVMVMIH